MTRRFVALLVAAAAFGAGAMLGLEPLGSTGQAQGTQPFVPRRLPNGQPDLQGVWRVWSLAAHDIEPHSPRWGVPAGPGVVVGGQIPYLPWAAAKKQENFKNSRTTDPLKSADPLSRCYLPGVPRITYLGFPFQIFQTNDMVVILYEWRHVRRMIYLKDIPRYEGADFWMGSSRGTFDGNTLVVDVRNLSDRTWFDASGNFHSEAAVITERYTPTGPDALQYEVTVEDPKVFARAWKMTMPIQRQKDAPILEYECHGLLEDTGIPITWDRLEYFK